LASGIAFLQLGNSSEARRTFERVAADYPGSPEAAKASARLPRLDGK
jgi:TolA-binding protein